jgi:large subunit ribosomal protein L13
MSTYMPKAADITRSWYVVDAANKPLGRVAAEVAVLLRGKHKVTFTPHMDCGDNVIVINAEKVVLTGKKLEQKIAYHHTGWVGHLKSVGYDVLMAEQPEEAMRLAVKGMIPANAIGRDALTRLHIYAGAEHKHAAQQPKTWEF